MKLSLSGRHALVLGGSCELALALADSLIEDGLYPILTYRSENGRQSIDEHLMNNRGNYETGYVDFAMPDSIDTLFDRIGKELDYVIDFAQGDFEAFVAAANQEDVTRYVQENITLRSRILKEASRLMLARRKGRFVFVSSTAALRPNPGQGFYAAAKLASEALYRNLGLELGKRGITTVTLRPGYVSAGRGRLFIEKNEKEVLRLIPTGKALSAEEITATIMFLLSDGAAGFNATEIIMDGGLTAGKQC
jgi:3-oxoacyl-[acyl-carrier protein] reductase